MRTIGLDSHRVFAEAVRLEGASLTWLGRIGMTRDHLAAVAATLETTDHVSVEATGNATAVAEILTPHVARVAVANPLKVHPIATAKTKTGKTKTAKTKTAKTKTGKTKTGKTKTGKIDATVLAKLSAAGVLPDVWTPDEAILARRRQVTRRREPVKQRVRPKGSVQSIRHAHLAPRCPHADLFGIKGRAWLKAQSLPEDDRAAVHPHIDDDDRQSDALKGVERDIARAALDDPNVKRIMTAPGATGSLPSARWRRSVGSTASRPRTSWSLMSGSTQVCAKPGDGPACHGRIAKRASTNARHLPVEAAWRAAPTGRCRAPGPLKAFCDRIRARRGNHIAAVAVARKLTVLVWHLLTKDEDHAWARPALMAGKMCTLDRAAGLPTKRGQRGSAYDDTLPERRQADRAIAEQAETVYRQTTYGWRRRGAKGAGATNEERQ